MQFFALPLLAVLVTGAFASPVKLEARDTCDNILPACFGGSIFGQVACACSGQVAPCDGWYCPGGGVVSLLPMST